MMRLKYIVFDVGGMTVPVAWPADLGLSHKDVARSVFIGIPISAGFCWPDKWDAHGESTTLELKSRPEDSAILVKYFGAGSTGSRLRGTAASAGFLVRDTSRSAVVPLSSQSLVIECDVCGEMTAVYASGHRCTRHRRIGGLPCPGVFKEVAYQSPKET